MIRFPLVLLIVALPQVALAQFETYAPTGGFDSPVFPQELTAPSPDIPDFAPDFQLPDGYPQVFDGVPASVPEYNGSLFYCQLYGATDSRCPLVDAAARPEDGVVAEIPSIPADRITILNPQAAAIAMLLINGTAVETVTIEVNATATRQVDPGAVLEARIASGGRELHFSLLPGVDYVVQPYNGSYFVVPVR